MNLRSLIDLIKVFRSLPKVTVHFSNDPEATRVFEQWSSRHPRLPLFRRKEVGVALVRLPAKFEDYLAGKEKDYLRRRRNKALRLGYEFREFDIDDHLHDVLEVNGSIDTRQGRAVELRYLDHKAVRAFHGTGGKTYGVFDKQGNLASYTYAPIYGDFAVLSRIFGHGQHLDNGVMYLMVAEVVRELLASRSMAPQLEWLNYDTWFGANEGLRYFKRNLGFRPYRVTWKIKTERMSAVRPSKNPDGEEKG